MSPLRDLRVTVVAGPSDGASVVETLRDAGAAVDLASLADFWSHVDASCALVVVIDRELPDAQVVVSELAGEERTKSIPRLVLASEARWPSELALARKGHACFLDVACSAEELLSAATDLTTRSRARADLEDQLHGLQEELRRSVAAADEARAAMTGFAHDIRVLLAVVVGFGCNLRDGIVGPLNEAQQLHASRIVAAAQDASGLLEPTAHSKAEPAPSRDLASGGAGADAARAADPPRKPRRVLANIGELLEDTLSLFEESARRRDVALTLECTELLHAWVDSVQMKQVFTNLIVNAVKFTPSGGRVTVLARRAAPRGEAGRSHVEIEVRDTGPGIAPEERDGVFVRHVRLDRDKDTPGTGIGLSVVRELVGIHGGTIAVTDAPGGGASFVLTLPVDRRRRSRGIIVVRASDDASRLCEALARVDPSALATADPGSVEFAAAAVTARAVLLLPTDDDFASELEAMIERVRVAGGPPAPQERP